MIVLRCYTVMDRWAIEASCIHGAGTEASHLLYREEVRRSTDGGAGDAFLAIEEAACRAYRRWREGGLGDTDECGL